MFVNKKRGRRENHNMFSKHIQNQLMPLCKCCVILVTLTTFQDEQVIQKHLPYRTWKAAARLAPSSLFLTKIMLPNRK